MQRVRLEIFNCLVLRLNATRIKNIYPQASHTHTLPHSVYFPCHTHRHTYNSCGTAVHPVEAEVSECLRFSHHFLSFCVRCCCRCNRSHQTKGYRCAIYVPYMQHATFRMVETIAIALFKEFSIFYLFAFELHNVVCSILLFILLEIYSSYLFIYSLAHLIKRNIVFPLHYLFIIIIMIMFVAVQTARHVAHYF